ncbi:MAG TPA: class I SAM-dependent methyltransferase [Terriglobales bacterium]|jgi:ubiquinone/menaquinone biosynthesis C-methylase UbiE|nr:class I SAM-dependent methyltransferase [Terriglobales bacterium]
MTPLRENRANFTRSDASAVKNTDWKPDDVRDQYSNANSHSDLYRYLTQWADFSSYLNIGYSKPRQKHDSPAAHERLIDRVATGLLKLRATGKYRDDSRLLDIASGRGGPAIYAHQKYGLEVLGVDFTPYNVRRATRNSKEKTTWPKVRFLAGNADALPIRSKSFSIAWSIESPAHFRNKPAFLREAARVLKPGGAFAFADLLVSDWRANKSAKSRRIYDEFLRAWDVPNLQTFKSYQAEIAKAGFKLCETEIATKYNLDIFERYCRPFLFLTGIPPVFAGYQQFVKWRTGAGLNNVHEHVLKSFDALRLGMIDYGIFWARRS